MLTKADRQIVREFQRRLADIVPVLDLRVFGSRARGEATPDSDLDMFIELEHGAMGANPLVLNVEREGVRP
jgi:predicted nucleotidyltransferase